MKFLIVEDDIKITEFLKKGLTEEGYTVDITHSGDEALYLVGINKYDLILLDIMLPGVDGLSFCKIVRKQNFNIPIIILSAKDSIDDKITGLNEGANDYIAKPFSFAELIARIRVQLRQNGSSETTKLQIADLQMDLLSKQVTRAGSVIKLTAKEFSLLEYLIRHKNQVLSETVINEAMSDLNESNISNIVNVYIYRLRNKIDKDFDKKLINTVRGMGFSIND
jgi:two-component system, OmpR family, copper resistance phosphate regulon response regulator CusR